MASVNPLILFALAVLVFILVLVGIRLMGGWVGRERLLDLPNDRSMHAFPVPRGGGLPLVASAGLIIVVYLLVTSFGSLLNAVPFFLGIVLVASVSWADDLSRLPNSARFAVQSIAAFVILLAYGCWDEVALPFVGQVQLGWLGKPLTFLWVVGLTNAYNFMDGIDGIAGAQGVIAGAGWSIVGLFFNAPMVAVTGAALAAGNAAFLFYNWNPARVFMGDVGSATLGFVFAALGVIPSSLESRSPILALLLVWPFVFDPALTFLTRLVKRENVFVAHRSHIYQRLVLLGLSPSHVTLLYSTLAGVGLLVSIAWIWQPGWSDFLFGFIVVLATALSLLPLLIQNNSSHLIHRNVPSHN